MIWVLTAQLAVLVSMFATAWVLWWRHNRMYARRQVIVNLKAGDAFRGVLWTRRVGLVVLKQAVLLGAEERPVDGEVLIFRSDVDFIQVL